MVRQRGEALCHGGEAGAAGAGSAGVAVSAAPPVLADTLAKLAAFTLHLNVVSATAAECDGLDADVLASPPTGALANVLRAFERQGIAANRKAASASLLLRIGWAGGFAIGAYLVCRRVPTLRDYTVCFSPQSLLHALKIRAATFVGVHDDPLADADGWSKSVRTSELPQLLVESLVGLTEPTIAAQHAWSGFSRHGLWAMATSSWAEQFTNITRQLGDEARGVREARALFERVPELKRAAPALYHVQGGGNSRTCQRRSACCLYFKSSTRYFCASCPIIPESERLERNRAWVEEQPRRHSP